MKFGIDEMILK